MELSENYKELSKNYNIKKDIENIKKDPVRKELSNTLNEEFTRRQKQ